MTDQEIGRCERCKGTHVVRVVSPDGLVDEECCPACRGHDGCEACAAERASCDGDTRRGPA